MKNISLLSQKGSLPVALSIVFAGILVAGAVILSGNNQEGPGLPSARASQDFRAPSDDDHIQGNTRAPITIVEYSDFECPFCGRLHPTLKRITEEYDDVKWVYRHFPLTSHANAKSAAIASECIALLAGNDAFWSFTEAVFSQTNGIGHDFYGEQASLYKINESDFASCMNSPDIAKEVEKDLAEVAALGGRGTPFSVIVGHDGDLVPVSGALPYPQFVRILDQVRNK